MRFFLPFILLFSAFPTLAQLKVKSGPRAGERLPDTFHPFNVNGKFGSQRDDKGELLRPGRPHALVTDYGLRPTVLVFAREGADGLSESLKQLLKKLDAAITDDIDDLLRGFVVVLSPDAHGSIFEVELPEEKRTTDPTLLIEQERKRDALTDRLEKFAKPFKKVVVAFYPSRGPKGYDIAEKAEVTVILYNKLRVVKSFAFARGQMTREDADRITSEVRALNGRKRQPLSPKRK